MPRRPKRPCSYPGCPELVEQGQGGKCEKHSRQQKRAYGREYDRTRATSTQRGYNASWRRLRKMVLNAEPLCRHCKQQDRLTPATEVDHIDGNIKNSSRDNLQPLCKSCHSRKSVKEQGALSGGNRQNNS